MPHQHFLALLVGVARWDGPIISKESSEAASSTTKAQVPGGPARSLQACASEEGLRPGLLDLLSTERPKRTQGWATPSGSTFISSGIILGAGPGSQHRQRSSRPWPPARTQTNAAPSRYREPGRLRKPRAIQHHVNHRPHRRHTNPGNAEGNQGKQPQ